MHHALMVEHLRDSITRGISFHVSTSIWKLIRTTYTAGQIKDQGALGHHAMYPSNDKPEQRVPQKTKIHVRTTRILSTVP